MSGTDFPTISPVVSNNTPFRPLTNEEIEKFFKELDTNNNGSVDFDELEKKLEQVHQELAPTPQCHNLHHPDRQKRDTWTRKQLDKHGEKHDVEKAEHVNPEHDGIHAFLCSLMPKCSESIPKNEFMDRVRLWNIPSMDQNCVEDETEHAKEYSKKLAFVRKVRAHWDMRGPKILFITCVIMLQLAFGLWQLIKYVNDPIANAALGWGVVMAKGSAGVLYPTLFFMVLSMSRWFATACRRFYYLSRFVDWDRHQSFHIWMACIALFFASLHAIGHLTGTFLYGSRPAQQDNLAILLGPDAVPKPYSAFVRTLPGWSGIVALGLFWINSLLSMPRVRKWSYEVFQLGHLLMFPMLGLLAAHGTTKLLQYPMLGFWLVFPTLSVLGERCLRVYRGISTVAATMKVLDDDTVAFTVRRPHGKPWQYSAGQYIFLQVPSISFFQWHPFTISACREDMLQVHIKTDGNWTGKIRNLPTDKEIRVGIDGPFGAPAQRFYEYDRALIIGAGVGVTPFSAILTDLEQQITGSEDPWLSRRSSRRVSMSQSRRYSQSRSPSTSATSHKVDGEGSPTSLKEAPAIMNMAENRARIKTSMHHNRRVDFHWMVREKNYLLWFSDLLNRAYDLAESLPAGTLELNIQPHITMKRENISTHVFRYLLDAYRTPTTPVSALTGLKARSAFGRPDFEDILERFHEDVRKEIVAGELEAGEKIGVFFCGAPVVGQVLSDVCHELTIRGRGDGSKIRWDFRIEVFG
jgi:predicted ferric reductase